VSIGEHAERVKIEASTCRQKTKSKMPIFVLKPVKGDACEVDAELTDSYVK